jgi:hypothetical protein
MSHKNRLKKYNPTVMFLKYLFSEGAGFDIMNKFSMISLVSTRKL